MSDDEAVGYGKPPVRTRFKKGVSGNKGGRPKGSKNFSTLFRKELIRKVWISENGQRRKVTKMEATIMQIVNRAATGDPKAIQILTNLSREFGDLKQPELAAEPEMQLIKLRVFARDFETGERFEVRPGTTERIQTVIPPEIDSNDEDGNSNVA
jgi:Family of unknown function (DUF5681)